MNPQLNAWIYTIGWALIHFVWQGGLIALATAAALASCRHRSSETRYAIACAGLVAMLAAPAITAAVVGTSDQTIAPGGSASPTVATSASPSPAPATARLQTASLSLAATAARTASTVERWLPIVVWAWLSGVVLLLARFAGASFRVRRLRLASLNEPLSQWQSTGERLAAQLRLDVGFRIVESALVDAPSVIGTMRPIIFLAGHGSHRPDAASDRGTDRSRAGPYPPAGLRRQHRSDRCRGAVVLSPGRVVDLGAHPPGARALLRRRRGRDLRGASRLCGRPRRARGVALARSGVVGRCRRWTTSRPRPSRVTRPERGCASIVRRIGSSGARLARVCRGHRALPHPRSRPRQHPRRQSKRSWSKPDPSRKRGASKGRTTSRSITRRTWTCTPSVPPRRPNGRTSMSAATCGTTWRFACRSSYSGRRPSSTTAYAPARLRARPASRPPAIASCSRSTSRQIAGPDSSPTRSRTSLHSTSFRGARRRHG